MSGYAVLGGTFDPVHLGHLHAARCARLAFDLDEVLLVPSAVPPHKSRADLAPAGDRLAMVRLAAATETFLSVSTLEIDRGGPSYTIDTLRALAALRPGEPPLFVLGTDAFLELRTWREPERLVRDFDLVVVDRPGSAIPHGAPDPGLWERLVAVPFEPGAGEALRRAGRPAEGRILRLEIPHLDVSSSEVRRRAAGGEPLTGLVPAPVGRYIHEQGLYVMEGRP
jgi:nicotinate-nucleotide adenylyltransferase